MSNIMRNSSNRRPLLPAALSISRNKISKVLLFSKQNLKSPLVAGEGRSSRRQCKTRNHGALDCRMPAPNHGMLLKMSPCDYTLPKKKNHGVRLKKCPFNNAMLQGKKTMEWYWKRVLVTTLRWHTRTHTHTHTHTHTLWWQALSILGTLLGTLWWQALSFLGTH